MPRLEFFDKFMIRAKYSVMVIELNWIIDVMALPHALVFIGNILQRIYVVVNREIYYLQDPHNIFVCAQ